MERSSNRRGYLFRPDDAPYPPLFIVDLASTPSSPSIPAIILPISMSPKEPDTAYRSTSKTCVRPAKNRRGGVAGAMFERGHVEERKQEFYAGKAWMGEGNTVRACCSLWLVSNYSGSRNNGRTQLCYISSPYCLVGFYQDNLIDESISQQESQRMLSMMKVFLDLVYAPAASGDKKAVDHFMCENVPETAIPAFYLFSRLLPGIIPRHAFDDLIQGYEMDLSFSLANETEGSRSSTNERSPIKTQDDLILYADRVAGSVADMICHLAWAILEDEQGRIPDPKRKKILGKAREMGQALQLVNVARDIRTDALLRRLYIPLDTFTNRQEDLKALFDIAEARPSIDYAQYTLPLLFTANKLRQGSAHDIERLPRTARAGTRAMVASYFEIGKEVERRGGRLEVERLKVSKWRRIGAVLACFWGWGIS
ncbi:hypothetical protein QFC19_007741 [Naganishia cerealis]|uniref:Uncharacterized protein n=1 Tax=Naganishia cerealis TaxID=610337 RepID=A0ACC2V7L2_9TREE|nr:hypothetical protein QFC19_007741 [Naganishia cerealis]